MKKSEMEFKSPSRQSRVALILIIYSRLKGFVSRLWPIILIGFFTGNFNFSNPDGLTLTIMILAVASGIAGIIAYFRYYYWIENDQFVIRKGVLSKSLTQIPMDRIQTVDFEQNLIHQIFNVVGLKIQTAGTQQAEIKMEALEVPIANALREYILSKKVDTIVTEDGTEIQSAVLPQEEIYRISFGRLIKIGLTENHLRSGFFIVFALWWFLDNLREAGLNLEDYEQEVSTAIGASLVIIGILSIVFLFLSIFISVARVVLQHFDLRLLRSDQGFKLISGLFNRKEVAAPYNKIQVLQWSQNLIQKFLGYHTIVMKQASSVEVSNKKSIQVPGVYAQDIQAIEDYLFPEREEKDIEYYAINKHFFIRPALYGGILTILLCVGLWFNKSAILFIAAVILFFLFFCYRKYLTLKKATYAINHQAVFLKGGAFGSSQWMTMLHKIQAVSIRQSPYQRRRKLADLDIHTASGTTSIPYIPLDRAAYLHDYLCYQIEVKEKHWM